jgi:hypothetical protein
MPHHADRPTKICAFCGRPFQWRRKWKDVWEEVRYCSARCRNAARRPNPDTLLGSAVWHRCLLCSPVPAAAFRSNAPPASTCG